MESTTSLRRLRTIGCAVVGAAIVSTGWASRVGGPAAPAAPASSAAASAVLRGTQQSAAVQNDESASLRQGIVTALGERGERIQVQGVWLGVAAGKTLLIRKGEAAPLETLKAGETIRFTVAPVAPVAPGAAEALELRVIYVP